MAVPRDTGHEATSRGRVEYYAQPLKPATKYHVVLTALASGNLGSAQAKGEFTTKARIQLLTSFDSIHVSNDGDGGTKGAGDLWWHFDTSYSSWSDGWHRVGVERWTPSPSTPTAKARTVAGALHLNGPSSVTVTSQGIEDDDGLGDFGCGSFGSLLGRAGGLVRGLQRGCLRDPGDQVR